MEILFEDPHIIAVSKPPGLSSQESLDPKRPHVISDLKKIFPEKTFFLHHRLDRDTSGVMILGKSHQANKPLTDIFRDHLAKKTYLALAKWGPLDQIGADLWRVENHLAPVRGGNKQRMRMVVVKKGGWSAITEFRRLARYENFQLLEASPLTGRTHQIRVHLACEKRPILGDNLYGGKSALVPRLMLHAASLEIPHPITREPLKIEAPMPKDFQTILGKSKLLSE